MHAKNPQPIKRLTGRKATANRARVMSRDCGLCQPCQRNGKLSQATQVDHILALINGGDDSDTNKEAICDECHRIKTIQDLGYNLPTQVGKDGMPTDKAHHWNTPADKQCKQPEGA